MIFYYTLINNIAYSYIVLSIHLSIHPFVHPSICSFIHPSVHSSIHLFCSILSTHPHHSLTPAQSAPHTPTTPQATPTTLWHERISGKVSLEPLIQEERKTPGETVITIIH